MPKNEPVVKESAGRPLKSALLEWGFGRCCCANCQSEEPEPPLTIFQPKALFAELANCKLSASRVFHVEHWDHRSRLRIVRSPDAARPEHE